MRLNVDSKTVTIKCKKDSEGEKNTSSKEENEEEFDEFKIEFS